MSDRPAVPDGALLLDVRRDDEWVAGHAPDAVHIPLDQLPDRVGELPRDQPITAVCHAGGRSARATAYLTGLGFDVSNYEGGMVAWARAGGPLVAENGREPDVG
jgi:rhodanese-related sulfurtransferase